ncbi:MAG TPA: 3-hydroxyacyl-ACP dehydratase FabZ family protein [Bryobacteraceae bacterium]|nr:3-hydroxyacyl-ACP dehydratase FabZ family protein [Bryobacteraceae bacterium]
MRFLLVDRITELESGKRARGIKNVTLSEDFFTFHFPYFPIMPGALITECLVQLADWTVRESENFAYVGMPCQFETIKFHNMVRPGDRLQLDVEVVDHPPERYVFRCEARCDGKVVAVGRFEMRVRPVEELMPIEESRRLFQVIHPMEAQ